MPSCPPRAGSFDCTGEEGTAHAARGTHSRAQSVTAECLESLLVYATTAANPTESSYACYYDEKRSTYLGDWYSVNWMEDSDVVSPRVRLCR